MGIEHLEQVLQRLGRGLDVLAAALGDELRFGAVLGMEAEHQTDQRRDVVERQVRTPLLPQNGLGFLIPLLSLDIIEGFAGKLRPWPHALGRSRIPLQDQTHEVDAV